MYISRAFCPSNKSVPYIPYFDSKLTLTPYHSYSSIFDYLYPFTLLSLLSLLPAVAVAPLYTFKTGPLAPLLTLRYQVLIPGKQYKYLHRVLDLMGNYQRSESLRDDRDNASDDLARGAELSEGAE